MKADADSQQSSRTREGDETAGHSMNVWLLLIGVAIMLVGSTFPILFTDASGKADHGIAMALFWSMAAGIVRGVGFVPDYFIFRWLFSGWSCISALLVVLLLRFCK